MGVEQAEALLAATGLAQVLEGKPASRQQLARSTRLEDELEEALVGYLQGRHSAPTPPPMPDELPPGLPPDAHGAVEGLAPEVATGYGLAAARALNYLGQLAPRRKLPSLGNRTGQPRLADRTATERAELRRAWAVLQDPVGTLGDLDAVTEDQLEALRVAYPTLWAHLSLAAAEAMAKVDRDLTQREERTLGRLMGVAPADVQDLQAMHQPPEGGGGKQPSGGGDAPSLESPVQHQQSRDASS